MAAKAPNRIRKVMSVTLLPEAIEALDKRAACLNISRSRMIERLARAYCTEDATEMNFTLRWVPGEGLEIETLDNNQL